MNKYVPLEDRCLIKEIKNSEMEKTKEGIHLPIERPERLGEVVAIGDGRHAFETGVFVKTVLKKGNTVLFIKDTGLPLDLDMDGRGEKQEYRLMREQDVLMKIS